MSTCCGLWPCHPWGGAQGSRLGHALIAKSAQDFVVLRNDDSLGVGAGPSQKLGRGWGGRGWGGAEKEKDKEVPEGTGDKVLQCLGLDKGGFTGDTHFVWNPAELMEK